MFGIHAPCIALPILYEKKFHNGSHIGMQCTAMIRERTVEQKMERDRTVQMGMEEEVLDATGLRHQFPQAFGTCWALNLKVCVS